MLGLIDEGKIILNVD
jgi:hypothetical protein